MSTSEQYAKQIIDIFLTGDWATTHSYKSLLDNVDWQQAIQSKEKLNSIASLVFHVNYYVHGIIEVFKGKSLTISDKFSFEMNKIQSQQDWEDLLAKFYHDAQEFAALVERMPESKLAEDFDDAKYGNYQKNIEGMIAHSYYHMGQIALIKKLIQHS